MPPIILGEPGQLNEWSGSLACKRKVSAKCDSGSRNEGRVIIFPETNQIIAIEEKDGKGFPHSFAYLLARECSQDASKTTDVLRLINEMIIEHKALCRASIMKVHLTPEESLANNVNMQLAGHGSVLAFGIRDGSINTNLTKEKNDPNPEAHLIGAPQSKLLDWKEVCGPIYQFVLASREVMCATTNGIIANIAKDPQNGVQTIWEYVGNNGKPGAARSLVHIGPLVYT